MAAPADKRALKILFDTYWTVAGWRKQPATCSEDFAYAKSVGVMFEPVLVTHDEAVDWALGCRKVVSKGAVVAGFLASLSSRRLDLRSALGSFAVLRNFPAHRWSRTQRPQHSCPICGAYERSASREDLNVLNFERFKWGGVRHENPLYMAFDLDRFARTDVPSPTNDDHAIMRQIIRTAASMQKGSKLSDLVKALAPVLPSNKAERRRLIGILGYCGILRDPLRKVCTTRRLGAALA
jgi:hypothetical protein